MKVNLEMDDVTITLRNNGIRLKITDSDGEGGTLRVGKATATWRPAGTRGAQDKHFKLEKLVDWLNAQ